MKKITQQRRYKICEYLLKTKIYRVLLKKIYFSLIFAINFIKILIIFNENDIINSP